MIFLNIMIVIIQNKEGWYDNLLMPNDTTRQLFQLSRYLLPHYWAYPFSTGGYLLTVCADISGGLTYSQEV